MTGRDEAVQVVRELALRMGLGELMLALERVRSEDGDKAFGFSVSTQAPGSLYRFKGEVWPDGEPELAMFAEADNPGGALALALREYVDGRLPWARE